MSDSPQPNPQLYEHRLEIEHKLRTGKIVARLHHQFRTNTAHSPTCVRLDNGLKAILKSSLEGGEAGPQMVRKEVAAYELDKAARLGLVPPTVLRKEKHVEYCLQYWCDDAVDSGDLSMVPEERRRVGAAFDLAIQQVDRLEHNWMVVPAHAGHPADLVLIDNGAAFDHVPAGGTPDPALWQPGQTYSALVLQVEDLGGPLTDCLVPLNDAAVLESVASLLDPSEMEGLRRRLDTLITGQ